MIDWTRIDQLKEEIGADDVAEVVEMFLEETDEGVNTLGSSAKDTKLAEVFHALKGSALNLGLSAFAEVCAKHEKSAAASEFDKIDIPSAVACYDASKAEFEQGLQARLDS